MNAPARTRLDATEDSFHVEACQRIEYSLSLTDGVFDPANPRLATASHPTWLRIHDQLR